MINDPAVVMPYSSRHFGDEDPVRVEAMRGRVAGTAAIGHVCSPRTSPADPAGPDPGQSGDRHAGQVLRAAALARPPARADLHVFPVDVASSHFPFLENPAAFNAVVEKFLD